MRSPKVALFLMAVMTSSCIRAHHRANLTTDSVQPAPSPIYWVGRTSPTGPKSGHFGWSGSGFIVHFRGTGVRIRAEDPSHYLTVVIDGALQPPLPTQSGVVKSYDLTGLLPDGEHFVEVYRRTEGSFGITTLHDVEVDGTFLPVEPATRRIEILGDSITCGYGNLGRGPECPFSPETENHYLTYGAIAARSLDAELSVVAWSGKGMVFNYGGDQDITLPELYNQTLPAQTEPIWDFSTHQPNVVLINLGTNDFSTETLPDRAQFVEGYTLFLERVRTYYPNAVILSGVAPMLVNKKLEVAQEYIQQAVKARAAAGDAQVQFVNLMVSVDSWGCDWHPSVATHELIAKKLETAIRLALGW